MWGKDTHGITGQKFASSHVRMLCGGKTRTAHKAGVVVPAITIAIAVVLS